MAQLVVRRTADGLGHAAARLLLARGPPPRGIYATARFCSNDKPPGGAPPTGGSLPTGGGSPSGGGRCPTCGGSPGGRCPTCGGSLPTAGGDPPSAKDLMDFQKRLFKLTAKEYSLHQQKVKQNMVSAEQEARAALLREKEEEAKVRQNMMDEVKAKLAAFADVLRQKEVEVKVREAEVKARQYAIDRVKAEQANLAALIWQKEVETKICEAEDKARRDAIDKDRACFDAEAKVKREAMNQERARLDAERAAMVMETRKRWFRKVFMLEMSKTEFTVLAILVLYIIEAISSALGTEDGPSGGGTEDGPSGGGTEDGPSGGGTEDGPSGKSSKSKHARVRAIAAALVVLCVQDTLEYSISVLKRANERANQRLAAKEREVKERKAEDTKDAGAAKGHEAEDTKDAGFGKKLLVVSYFVAAVIEVLLKDKIVVKSNLLLRAIRVANERQAAKEREK